VSAWGNTHTHSRVLRAITPTGHSRQYASHCSFHAHSPKTVDRHSSHPLSTPAQGATSPTLLPKLTAQENVLPLACSCTAPSSSATQPFCVRWFAGVSDSALCLPNRMSTAAPFSWEVRACVRKTRPDRTTRTPHPTHYSIHHSLAKVVTSTFCALCTLA
jgi:hypothetical protein